MSTAILDGTKTNNEISTILLESLSELGEGYEHLQLEAMNIKCCKSCGGCNYKTPGECVLKDDTPKLVRTVVKNERFIILTPISFGGYAATTKKALDKLGLAGLPTFINFKGRLQHPSRYKKIEANALQVNIIIAVLQENSLLEQKSFQKLIKANSEIMMMSNKLLFIKEDDNKNTIKTQIIKVLEEVVK